MSRVRGDPTSLQEQEQLPSATFSGNDLINFRDEEAAALFGLQERRAPYVPFTQREGDPLEKLQVAVERQNLVVAKWLLQEYPELDVNAELVLPREESRRALYVSTCNVYHKRRSFTREERVLLPSLDNIKTLGGAPKFRLLQVAIATANPEMVSLLIRKGAAVDPFLLQSTLQRQMYVMLSCEKHHEECTCIRFERLRTIADLLRCALSNANIIVQKDAACHASPGQTIKKKLSGFFPFAPT